MNDLPSSREVNMKACIRVKVLVMRYIVFECHKCITSHYLAARSVLSKDKDLNCKGFSSDSQMPISPSSGFSIRYL